MHVRPGRWCGGRLRLPGSGFFCLGGWRPGQAAGFLCGAWSVGFDLGPVASWWSTDQGGTMAPVIGAGIPSAASGPGAAIV